MSAWLCLRTHRAYIRLRFLCATPTVTLLRCDKCEAFR